VHGWQEPVCIEGRRTLQGRHPGLRHGLIETIQRNLPCQTLLSIPLFAPSISAVSCGRRHF
jgi:hypothetical protein